jgi:hypothetical protein
LNFRKGIQRIDTNTGKEREFQLEERQEFSEKSVML